jgi:hypothetical protein
MTYNDNRPRRSNNDDWGTGTVALVALFGILLLGGLIYGLSDPSTATVSNTAASTTPTTTGAGGRAARTEDAIRF